MATPTSQHLNAYRLQSSRMRHRSSGSSTAAASLARRLRSPKPKTPRFAQQPRPLNELSHAPDDLDLVDGSTGGEDVAL